MDKQELLNGISKDSTFDNRFFKRVYGYSILDKAFLDTVAKRLIEIGKKDIIQLFNNWVSEYEHEQSKIIKSVASWYIKECEKKYQDLVKKDSISLKKDIEMPDKKNIEIPNKKDRRSDEKWQEKRKELLLQKKKLIIMQNLKQSTGN